MLAAHGYAHRIAWAERDTAGDGNWLVYVAHASHATYPKPGRWRGKKHGPLQPDLLDDYADGGGVRRHPELQPIRIGAPAWVGWPGRWGVTKPKPVIGGGSPRGPWRQGPWKDPDGFADEAFPWKQHHVPAHEALAAPAAPPAVTVGRAGDGWTISIALAAGTEAEWAGSLTLATSGADAPVLHTYDVSRPGPARADDA